jgi:hypothetical protein
MSSAWFTLLRAHVLRETAAGLLADYLWVNVRGTETLARAPALAGNRANDA